MSEGQCDWFAGVEEVVADPLRFKLKLGIGEDAYKSLRVRRAVSDVWDAVGAATFAASAAKSSVVATTFFSSSGLLSMIGVGTAATPVGWVIGAAVVAGGAWIGLTRYMREQTEARVKTVPEFINTPLDILGLALFDLMAPLALKVAHVDGDMSEAETRVIERWFVHSWGYDHNFVAQGLDFFRARLDDATIVEIATSLARYKRENPDCNYKAMTSEISRFLRELIEADGVVDELEELAVERIEQVFEDEGRRQLGRAATEIGRKVSETVGAAGSAVATGATKVVKGTISGASRLGSTASEAVSETIRASTNQLSRIGERILGRKDPSEGGR